MSCFFPLLAFVFLFASLGSADPVQDSPFAVVELFSSEGCSSCPAADSLVSKLTAWAREHNESVYPLIFHVDYWNNNGWRDVYSRAEFTKRQAAYSRVFKDQGLYTPEMIVNGTDAFVGSNKERLQNELDHELTLPANVNLQFSLTQRDDSTIVKYTVQGYSQGDVVNVALVERGLSTDVTAGENAGRSLHHDNIVREFQTVPVNGPSAEVKISLKRLVDPSQASVIVYVQDPHTMLIEDAKQMDLINE